jgi:hypothetical protein
VALFTAEGRIPDHYIVSRIAVILVLAAAVLSLATPSGVAPGSKGRSGRRPRQSSFGTPLQSPCLCTTSSDSLQQQTR